MNHLQAVKAALDYMERNLREEIAVDDVAQAAHFSTSHFHAIFPKAVGCTAAEHLRKRRLACAALDLALSRRRILDIALEYRFESQEAFTRAFKRLYGVTPGLFRRNRDGLPFCPLFGIYSPGDPTSRGGAEPVKSGMTGDFATRLVLDGVMKVGFRLEPGRCPEDIPFAACLASALRYVGEDFDWMPIVAHNRTWRLNYGNVHILGASGMAFGLLWRDGWHTDNVDHMFVADPREVIRRAFDSVGYSHEVVEKTGSPEDEERYREAICRSLQQGRPVLGFGVVGPPECSLITGYDEGGDVLLGWSYFQDDANWSQGLTYEPSGYFRKRDWFGETRSLLVIGEKTAQRDLHERNRDSLRWGLDIARTPASFGRQSGLAAYTAWASHVADDAHFASKGEDELRQHHQVHFLAAVTMAECRAWASIYLREMAEAEPAMAEDLFAAADCFSAEHDLMWKMWSIEGGHGNPEGFRKFADPAVRKQCVEIILECRRLDERAGAYIEQALFR